MDGEIPSEKPVPDHPNAVRPSITSEQALPEQVLPESMPDTEPLPKIESLPPNYHKKPKRGKRPFLIALIVLLLIAGAIYWFFLRAQPATAPTKSSTSSQNSTNGTSASEDTQHHESTNFNLGFDYPKNWTVLDDENAIKAISPATKLKDANNQEIDGQIVMYIVSGADGVKQLDDKHASVAILDSEKITYTKPTETQRGSTYMSFLDYYNPTDTGLDGIYITGDNGYKKDQKIPKVDILKSDPIIYVTFNKCPASSNCTEPGSPITISADSWASNDFADPIKNMLESLAIQ